MSEPVLIAPTVFDVLTLDAWNALSDAERLQAADHLTERLELHGWIPTEPPALRRFGPPGGEQAVLQWQDGRSGLTFSLIPGGTFRPGYAPALLEEYDRVYRLLQAGDFEEREPDEDEDEEDRWEPRTESPMDEVREKAAVTVGPSLMATEWLRRQTPGVAPLLDPAVIRIYDSVQDRLRYPAYPTWEEVPRVLGLFGWSLPSSEEFEWALRGGAAELFYWGNVIPLWIAEMQVYPPPAPDDPRFTAAIPFEALMDVQMLPERPRRWPWCNRFGLAAPLATKTWCAERVGEGGATLLDARGGGADCFPWQYCGEWTLFLTAGERRWRTRPPASAARRRATPCGRCCACAPALACA